MKRYCETHGCELAGFHLELFCPQCERTNAEETEEIWFGYAALSSGFEVGDELSPINCYTTQAAAQAVCDSSTETVFRCMAVADIIAIGDDYWAATVRLMEKMT